MNREDPHALTDRIQFLVRHDMPFTEFQGLLEELLRKPHEENWTAYEEFMELLELYRDELDGGSPLASEAKAKVVDFSGHCETPDSP